MLKHLQSIPGVSFPYFAIYICNCGIADADLCLKLLQLEQNYRIGPGIGNKSALTLVGAAARLGGFLMF